MPYPFTFTEEELAIIKAQLLTGVARVTIGDREVQFRSWAELSTILEGSLSDVQSTRRLNFMTDSGL